MARISFQRWLLVAAALVSLGACSKPADPVVETVAVQAAPAEMDTLVSAEWLLDHIGDPDLVVLDATVVMERHEDGSFEAVNGRAQYGAGHIPGAGFADLMGELADLDSPLQYAVPSPEAFAAAMGALGVGDDSRVVLYDASGSAWAARVWWMLRWVGFDNAALLDGGLAAWKAAGGELATESSNRPARTLTVNLRPGLIVGQDAVRAAIDDESVTLVDALPEPFYRGEVTMYARPGHITSAVNLPITSLFDEQGRLRPNEELASMVDLDPGARTITYCGGGIAASADAFALTRLGFEDVAVYSASLQEWSANPENPMEVGAVTGGGD